MRRSFVLFGLSLGLVTVTACDKAKFAANLNAGVLDKATAAFDEERDPWLARAAATSNLKLYEGLLQAAPENKTLLVLAASAYAFYASAFLEDELEELEQRDAGSSAHGELRARIGTYYLRARHYAERRMDLDFEDFSRAMGRRGDRLAQILSTCEEEHVAALYWLAFACRGHAANYADDPAQSTDLANVTRVMGWVRERSPGFDGGGPHRYFGLLGSALGRGLSGGMDAARQSFEAAVAASDGKSLLAKVQLARAIHAAMNDRKAYEQTLRELLDASEDLSAPLRLSNAIAKARARRWLEQSDALFGSATPAASTIELSVATLSPESSSAALILRGAARELHTRSSGRVTLRVHAGGQRGDATAMSEGLASGTLAGAQLRASDLVPELAVLQAPRLITTAAQLDFVLKKLTPRIEKALLDKGLVLLGVTDGGLRYAVSTGRIAAPPDLQKRSFGVENGDREAMSVATKASATVTPFETRDLGAQLAAGHVTTALASPLQALTLGWFESLKTVTGYPLALTVGATVLRKVDWDRLSAADRALVKDIMARWHATLVTRSRVDADRAVTTLRARGIEFVPVDTAAAAQWDALARAVQDEPAGKSYPKALLDEVRAWVKQAP